jgi:hypothetical protein
MANDIGVGDLVCVVKGRECCGHGGIGLVFTITVIDMDDWSHCDVCGDLSPAPAAHVYGGTSVELSRLQKINPPATATEAQTVSHWHEKKHYPVKA